MTKKNSDELRVNKIIHRAKVEVADFEALLYRFERNISILGRSKSTFENYARHVATIALHYGQISTLLGQEQKSRRKPALPNIFKSNDNSIKETTEADRYPRLSSTSPSWFGLQPPRNLSY